MLRHRSNLAIACVINGHCLYFEMGIEHKIIKIYVMTGSGA